jgi:hypothetical protein
VNKYALLGVHRWCSRTMLDGMLESGVERRVRTNLSQDTDIIVSPKNHSES